MSPRSTGDASPLPLAGLKVLDLGILFAGPVIATMMGDYGADVIKVEHPSGDTLRKVGWEKDGVSLWWAMASRNKRCITLDLSTEPGQRLLRRLAEDADVLVESFRPGTLERWGIGPDALLELNERLVIVRTTAFGQTGPYKDRPGFGTLAEAISGYAHINGWPDGPPTLPPFALGDGVAALVGTAAAMFALWWREHGEGGRGQVIDLSIYEPLFGLLGPQALVYDQLGVVQGPTGNRAPFTAPRNLYRTSDGQWVALSASPISIATRVMKIIGREDLIAAPWFGETGGRVEHVDELDDAIQAWIGERTRAEVVAAFEQFEAALSPVYSIADIFEDPQYAARDSVTTVDHPRLGPLRMPGVVPRMEATPGRIAHAGPGLGEHNREILGGRLGLTDEELDALRREGAI